MKDWEGIEAKAGIIVLVSDDATGDLFWDLVLMSISLWVSDMREWAERERERKVQNRRGR